MNRADLAEQVAIELEAIQQTLGQLEELLRDVADREPTPREVAAAGLFLANLYNGIEHIFKRISQYHEVPVPSGDGWHVQLARGFEHPARAGLPTLLDAKLARQLGAYRRFRHVIHHGYGIHLRWEDMLPGIQGASDVVARFQEAVQSHLDSLGLPPN